MSVAAVRLMCDYAIDPQKKPPRAQNAADNENDDEGALSPGPESEDESDNLSTFISPVSAYDWPMRPKPSQIPTNCYRSSNLKELWKCRHLRRNFRNFQVVGQLAVQYPTQEVLVDHHLLAICLVVLLHHLHACCCCRSVMPAYWKNLVRSQPIAFSVSGLSCNT